MNESNTTQGPAFDIVVQHIDGRAELLVIGELDMASVSLLRAALDRLIADSHYDVRLNMSGLRFLDAVGIGALANAHRRLSELGGRLTVSGAQGTPLRVLAICCLLDTLTAHEGRKTPNGPADVAR